MKQYIRDISKSITPIIGMVVFAGLTQEAQAMPMFTAQTGMDCTGCHTQHMPRLNKFGRKFAASGMTLSKQMEGMDANPSMLIKSKYAKTWDKPNGKGVILDEGTNEGELSVIRMATFSYGGRMTENVGGILNLGWRKEEGDSISGKVVYAQEVEDGYWGVAAYSTPSFGPFSGMEFYNTGLYKPLRTFDMRIYSNANSATRVGAKAATGFQAYYDTDNLVSNGDHFFITAGIYTPGQDNAGLDMSDNILPFARIAYEHPIGDYNLIIGAYAIVGGDSSPTDTHVTSTQSLSIKRETYGMDLQIEGAIGDNEVTLAMSQVFKNNVEFTGIGAQLTKDTEDIEDESFSVEVAYTVIPSIIAKVGYMTFDDVLDYPGKGLDLDGNPEDKVDVKDLDYAITLGMDYGFTVTNMPMKLALEYAWMKPTLDRVENYESFMATLTLPF